MGSMKMGFKTTIEIVHNDLPFLETLSKQLISPHWLFVDLLKSTMLRKIVVNPSMPTRSSRMTKVA
jgi:hypothetical protein